MFTVIVCLQIPYPWPLTPVKGAAGTDKPSFTDLIFPEDDDDEDYNPESDAANV